MRKNAEAPVSSGATDSSVEASVTGVERCGGVVRAESVRQPRNGEERARAVKPFGIYKRVVWEAWRHVKANRGAAGVDDESIAMHEANLKDNLYRIWNRMSSGSYFRPAVRLVEIPKKNGGVRTLDIMLRRIRSWKLQRQTPASIGELAARYNPILRGWWNYYCRFYKTALRRVFESFEATLARWARRKYKKLLWHEGRSFLWLWRVARRQPGLFVHWRAYGQAGGPAMGAV